MAKKYLLGLLFSVAVAFAQKTAPDLDFGAASASRDASSKGKERISVIVQYEEGAAESSVAKSAQRRGVGRLIQPLASMDAEVLEVTPEELEALKSDTRVTYISRRTAR